MFNLAKNKKTSDKWQEAKKIIPGGAQLFSKRPELYLPDFWPAYFQKAQGVYLWDLDGHRYLDMSSMGLGSCILGYAYPKVNQAVKKAIDQGSMSSLNPPEEVDLTNLLLRLHPWAQMARYARTGGEAMTIALRIARASTSRDKVAFCGYHGWQDWYLSANLADDKNLDGHLIPGLQPKGVPRALQGTALPFHYNKINELEELLAKNKGEIAAIIMEPFREQEPQDDFLNKVRKLADESGALLIIDEITAGFRFCLGGAHLKYQLVPDMAVFAKAMSNGFPMAAVLGKKEVMRAAEETFISSTYWTERLGPTAALATIKEIEEKNIPQYLERLGAKIIKGLKEAAKTADLKVKITGQPALIHLSFDYGQESQIIRTLFSQEMLRRGILATSGIYLCLSHQAEHVAVYLKAVEEVFPLLSQAIKQNKTAALLKGPVAVSGFSRLTD